jgi:hypothetical protein
MAAAPQHGERWEREIARNIALDAPYRVVARQDGGSGKQVPTFPENVLAWRVSKSWLAR